MKNKFTRIFEIKYPVTSGFYALRGNEYHQAIDIAAPVGTPILAPLNGVVKSLYYNSRGGNQLIIQHDNGMITGYAHLYESLYNVGQRVKQGEVIALSGDTGTGTGAHLHFTLRNGGDKIDPLPYYELSYTVPPVQANVFGSKLIKVLPWVTLATLLIKLSHDARKETS